MLVSMVLCSPLLGRPKSCMRMLLEASRAAPQDLPPDMEFFQVSTTHLTLVFVSAMMAQSLALLSCRV